MIELAELTDLALEQLKTAKTNEIICHQDFELMKRCGLYLLMIFCNSNQKSLNFLKDKIFIVENLR